VGQDCLPGHRAGAGPGERASFYHCFHSPPKIISHTIPNYKSCYSKLFKSNDTEPRWRTPKASPQCGYTYPRWRLRNRGFNNVTPGWPWVKRIDCAIAESTTSTLGESHDVLHKAVPPSHFMEPLKIPASSERPLQASNRLQRWTARCGDDVVGKESTLFMGHRPPYQ
jgi:hypothetical protein